MSTTSAPVREPARLRVAAATVPVLTSDEAVAVAADVAADSPRRRSGVIGGTSSTARRCPTTASSDLHPRKDTPTP
ncbi:hypothetical protein [Nocardioides xinjiangensis]|uniref:hypothetical protein n=1 Tax=Nocardioides xinjiangensis TaxID=2817376 RepID=UPI001B3039CC|nr:hypothetical protein [Nocardioides sp. SYSU D00778]